MPHPIVINLGRAGYADGRAERHCANCCTPRRSCDGLVHRRGDIHRLKLLCSRRRCHNSCDCLRDHRRRCRDGDIHFCCGCTGGHRLCDRDCAPLGAAVDRNDGVVCASYKNRFWLRVVRSRYEWQSDRERVQGRESHKRRER
jgi:hypothetical protein